ncbi:DegT/DnrJ/EryC1/StrS family aminotransferase [Brevibacillus sp. NRS-1366]|uniref:DegT/DnrJ/EryC1/StrS family aminotransferase n=1 Tax=Brevibacillus sp. NRS-1366 TaxID=3233899 RepID=UPI003D1C9F3F
MFVPLSKPAIGLLEKLYVLQVLESGQLSLGPKLNQFEEAFRNEFQAKYAVAMNSGTSALHVAVKALGLGPGDEVITTPYSFVASSNCLLYEGVTPVFVDIDPRTLNMDTTRIEEKITSRTKAILAVHVFGQPCDMDEIGRIAVKYNLRVIEDACESLGAEWKGRKAGLLGDAGVFAFYPNKQITTGEGGILLTNQEAIYRMACSYRNQGRDLESEWLDHPVIGYNYRMSDLQAAVGVAQMERLHEILLKREAAAMRYIRLIEEYQPPISLPEISPDCKMSWFIFVVILPESADRKPLMQRLKEKGIQTKPYFPSIHLQSSYISRYGFKPGEYPISEKMSERTLAIPFYTDLIPEEQEYVIHHLSLALEGRDTT